MTLRPVEYSDSDGRRFLANLPFGVPDSQAQNGIPLGPPSLSSLGLPLDAEVRLHNELFERGILTEQDARRRINDVAAAIRAAFRTDVHRILAVYQGGGTVNEKEHSGASPT